MFANPVVTKNPIHTFPKYHIYTYIAGLFIYIDFNSQSMIPQTPEQT